MTLVVTALVKITQVIMTLVVTALIKTTPVIMTLVVTTLAVNIKTTLLILDCN